MSIIVYEDYFNVQDFSNLSFALFSFCVFPHWCENTIIGIGKLSTADGKAFADPEVLRRLTSSVSCALDEAAAALTRMRAESTANAGQSDK